MTGPGPTWQEYRVLEERVNRLETHLMTLVILLVVAMLVVLFGAFL